MLITKQLMKLDLCKHKISRLGITRRLFFNQKVDNQIYLGLLLTRQNRQHLPPKGLNKLLLISVYIMQIKMRHAGFDVVHEPLNVLVYAVRYAYEISHFVGFYHRSCRIKGCGHFNVR
jgi:hypothetical protein